MRKAFQIFWQASLVRSLVKPARELFRVFGGKLRVSGPSGQLDDSLRAEHAVEVFMEQNFGEALQKCVIKLHWGLPGSAKVGKLFGKNLA